MHPELILMILNLMTKDISMKIGHTSRIFSLALASLPDGGRIAASGSHDRTVKVWCLNSNRLLRSIDYADFVWRVFLVTISSGKLLVVAFISAEDKIVISDAHTGDTERVLYGRLLFAGLIPTYPSPTVILATGDEDISIVDVQTGRLIHFITVAVAAPFILINNINHFISN
jgi:WD40 repeat protein